LNASEALPEIRALRDTLKTLPASSNWLLPDSSFGQSKLKETLAAAGHRLEPDSRVP